VGNRTYRIPPHIHC